jgi:hypothetical protein
MSRYHSIDGVKIVDAKRDLTINITPADIKRAKPKQPGACAVAQACMRESGFECRVHMSRMYVKTAPNRWERFFISPFTRTEIAVFDRGGRFEPVTVIAQKVPPGSTIEAVATRNAARNTHTKPTGQKRRPHVNLKGVRVGPKQGGE